MIHVLRDDERLAVVRLGQYQGLKGPGIVVTLPFIDLTTRIRMGDVGNLVTIDLVTFGGMNVPVTGDELWGSEVRVVGFEEEIVPSRPRVVRV